MHTTPENIGVSFEAVGAVTREAMEAVAPLCSSRTPNISVMAIAYLKGKRATLDHVADIEAYDTLTAALVMLASDDEQRHNG